MNIKLIAKAMIEAGYTKERLGLMSEDITEGQAIIKAAEDYFGWSDALLNIIENEYSIESLVRDEILRG